jgi:hypothetical protein
MMHRRMRKSKILIVRLRVRISGPIQIFQILISFVKASRGKEVRVTLVCIWTEFGAGFGGMEVTMH